ncbi:2'-5' RNA ligase family protein [Photobacterium sp. SDRW27]|uniref:2'-5' RNA ligase family protein n=1 Tax=Photobacterium obscurum TaxID=2829490 RepID=UPI002242FCDC|nr:2'-5' RNA ligase family protein [Photobacterium obscurum]MCW8328832.1 2'-5' RNA ligase family protein [Photobacterium obscurum]
MEISKPTYIVAELSGEVASWIHSTRVTLEPGIAHFPEEITLAGSSGVGPISKGQKLSVVISQLEQVLQSQPCIQFKFKGISHFPGTEIFFVEPEREDFDRLHAKIIETAIVFDDSPFPYNPHCTLKSLTSVESFHEDIISNLVIPVSEHCIRKISIYELDVMKSIKLWERELIKTSR